ncbi:hypothetical protein FOZ60_013589 [Perkinsus olseni]|uniref:Uncharacterized protein n=1 Tax=Perkinsus olseni TaxID=32597 RepID=A0A7J6N9G1_PEROL|nr:hypothetical protein FOZ60_013589 [Perkinsus olseni]
MGKGSKTTYLDEEQAAKRSAPGPGAYEVATKTSSLQLDRGTKIVRDYVKNGREPSFIPPPEDSPGPAGYSVDRFHRQERLRRLGTLHATLLVLLDLVLSVLGDPVEIESSVTDAPLRLPPIGFTAPDATAVSIEPVASHLLIKVVSLVVMLLTLSQLSLLAWSSAQLFLEEVSSGKRLYLHHEARMRQHVLPDIRAQMRHSLEEASRIPKVVRPAIHQGFQTAMALNGALDGERSMVGHADIKEIARDVMGDAGKALYHFDKFQAMTEKLRDEMKPMDHDLKVNSMANLWLMPVCDDDEISDTADVGNFLCSFLIVLASLDVCTRH